MQHNLQRFPGARTAAEACAVYTCTLIESAIAARGYATLAVSGGTSPKMMFERMAAMPLAWDRLHVFWVDERAVPPTDAESNYRLASESWLSKVAMPERNIHRVRAEMDPRAAARVYAEEIRSFFGLGRGDLPQFDIIHRGMGPDAHTASLFPGEPMIDDHVGLAAAVYAQSKSQWRITLLPGVLMEARNTVMLVAGEYKAEPLRAVLCDPADPVHLPAQINPPDGRGVVWFVDHAAARLLEMTA